MNKYKVVSRDASKIEVRAVVQTTTHNIVDAMAYDDVIPQWAADQIRQQQVSTMMQRGETLTVQLTSASGSAPPPLPSKQRDERKEKMMAKRLVDTLVKQYAPDADTAWGWMRQAHEMGWELGNHALGGPTASDPLGQHVTKSIATAFSNDAGVYVGICLVGGAIRWGWFRAAEWGPRGRDLVLSGDRNHHETPIAAIAEYTLLGESTPMKALPLDDVFGGSWDD